MEQRPTSWKVLDRRVGLVLAFLMIVSLSAARLGAQVVSPGSIAIDPSNACGGGSDQVDDVCITLPEGVTCSTVDVFLLFDDTGSFGDFTQATGDVFIDIVDELATELPGVSFAFGVGRFEDFGGPGADFAEPNLAPLDRPFLLNQAILERTSDSFSSDLSAALSAVGDMAANGGDGPESALEALFQVATGTGFNGNPDTNASVLDSGPAGDPTTWENPGLSGDVPDFASYVGTKSGELGGVGWRADSCLRLVLLATDICTVATFAAGEPIPDSIEGSGATVPSSAFSCNGAERFGFVSDAESEARNTVPGAEAPVGAATVAETVEALNDLGIRVVGLGPGASPTLSTAPSTQPSTFLSALARVTGAVDEDGEPLVLDLGSDSADVQTAIVDAVETSVRAPIDVALVPDPEIPGLTVTASPPVQESVGPGEEACFWVTFEGSESFAGGNLGLTFADTASNGSLAMSVPVSLRCPDCFDLVPRQLLCDADENGFAGSFEWTFLIRNRTKDDIHHLFFVDLPADVSVEPQHLTFSPPIKPNQPKLVTVKIVGATPGTLLDFRITLHDAAIDQCCAEEVQLELPACDCVQLPVDRNPRCVTFPFVNAGPPWRYTFSLENLTTVPVSYLLFAPVSPEDSLTPVSPSELAIAPDVLILDSTLNGGDETGPISVDISGPAARPGGEVCFRVSTHDTSFSDCCSIVRCLTIPDCFFGSVDFEPLGGATLYRSGDALVVSEIGASGEDGVAASFGPARSVGISLQDFSVGVDLPEGASVRFAVHGAIDGARQEVANLSATLAHGRVVIAPDPSAPSVGEVLILRGGEVVASSRQAEAVAAAADWPTRFVMQDDLIGIASQGSLAERGLVTSNNVAGVAWSRPMPLSFADGGAFEGDQVLFIFEEPRAVEGLTGGELTGRDVGAVVIKRFDSSIPVF